MPVTSHPHHPHSRPTAWIVPAALACAAVGAVRPRRCHTRSPLGPSAAGAPAPAAAAARHHAAASPSAAAPLAAATAARSVAAAAAQEAAAAAPRAHPALEGQAEEAPATPAPAACHSGCRAAAAAVGATAASRHRCRILLQPPRLAVAAPAATHPRAPAPAVACACRRQHRPARRPVCVGRRLAALAQPLSSRPRPAHKAAIVQVPLTGPTAAASHKLAVHWERAFAASSTHLIVLLFVCLPPLLPLLLLWLCLPMLLLPLLSSSKATIIKVAPLCCTAIRVGQRPLRVFCLNLSPGRVVLLSHQAAVLGAVAAGKDALQGLLLAAQLALPPAQGRQAAPAGCAHEARVGCCRSRCRLAGRCAWCQFCCFFCCRRPLLRQHKSPRCLLLLVHLEGEACSRYPATLLSGVDSKGAGERAAAAG